MEDIKGFVWVIAAVVFFIWRMVQKAAEKAKEAQVRQQARQPGGAPAPRPAPAVPAVSFEELLAQMQRQNQQPAPPEPRPLAERDPPQEWEQRREQWDQEQQGQEPPAKPARPAPVPRFGRGLESTEIDAYSQELPAREARSLEAPKRAPRLAQNQPRTSTQHGSEDFWSQKQISPKQTRRTVNELLQNPADIRAAFVLSEIFQRRY
ncbi:hypothetical protein [Hymenobacter psychrophilus]|uniref:Uncharacterized protein n=1 Tax=Hymenobacter psychrophilus TaxID=651662 RepID=A0A1H3BRT4_9BACT|nr:hypothetical protein [Hymenobacter psychrophilus]SDX44633.1 hypothetical protein SAMN04488069_101396 [Hymenobacter psychrophilus]